MRVKAQRARFCLFPFELVVGNKCEWKFVCAPLKQILAMSDDAGMEFLPARAAASGILQRFTKLDGTWRRSGV
jgi:hypothetical protein